LARELVRRTTAGTLYVLDEPTAGLHRSDVEAVMHLLGGLVDEGATVVIIEHDPAVIALADHVIDLGPGAGPDGGELLWQGSVEGLRDLAGSRTAEALRAHLGA
jgi:excinuclease UvrABC ATPase subunit